MHAAFNGNQYDIQLVASNQGAASVATDSEVSFYLADLLCHFTTVDLHLEVGDSVAVLDGATFGGRPIRGRDTIRVVP